MGFGNNLSNAINALNNFNASKILIGGNVNPIPLVSPRDYFLTQLNSWVSTPSLKSQWICIIDNYPKAIYGPLIRNLERTGGDSTAYDVSLAKSLLTSFPLQRVVGCVFANEVQIPEESYRIESAPISNNNNRGFIPGIIAGSRNSYDSSPLVIKFYESNLSFLDFVIRPWVMLASHYGHVTRKTNDYSVKCNITLLWYGKTYQNINQIPRKIFKYYNCVPYQVSQQTYDYEEANTPLGFSVNFSYTNYTVSNNLYIPLPQIISSISTKTLSFPKISPFQR